jgi:hypothetical protein
LGFAHCPHCNFRQGIQTKIGTKYLHFRCRKCRRVWKIEIGSPEYDSSNYGVLKFKSQEAQLTVYSKKLKAQFNRYKDRIPENIAWDSIITDFDGDYERAHAHLTGMNTPALFAFLNSYEVVE